MKFSLAFSLFCTGTAAFAPRKVDVQTSTTAINSLNGWTPDESKVAYGLPGAIPPFEDGFDPLKLSEGKSVEEIKYWREAETQHGRVAM